MQSPSAIRKRQVADRVRRLLSENVGDLPAGRAERIRIDPGRGGVLAMSVAVVVAAVVTGAWVLSARPHQDVGQPAAVRSAVPASGSSTAGPNRAPTATTALVVDVAGKVRRPGLYRLPSGSRVDDAVRAAGGVVTGVDPATVNLAARVSDGQQIVVGVTGVPPPGVAGAQPGAAASPIDINTASVDQLQTLPGVGPVLAQHIFDWRTTHGAFASVDQLRQVPGIGPAKLAAMRPLVLT